MLQLFKRTRQLFDVDGAGFTTSEYSLICFESPNNTSPTIKSKVVDNRKDSIARVLWSALLQRRRLGRSKLPVVKLFENSYCVKSTDKVCSLMILIISIVVVRDYFRNFEGNQNLQFLTDV